MREQFDERRERDAVAVGGCLADENRRPFANRLRECGREPRLSDAGRREDGDEHARGRIDRVVERLAEHGQMAVTSDKRRLGPGRRGTNAQDLVGMNRLGLPFEVECAQRIELHSPPKQRLHRPRDHHVAGLGRRLKARRRIEHVSRDPTLDGCRLVGERLAAVDRDPHLDPHLGISDLRVELGGSLAHLERGADSAQRVVLVRLRHTEGADHRIPDELLDGPSVPLDRRTHRIEVTVEHLAQYLCIQTFTEPGRADEVAEQRRDQAPAGLPGLRECGATLPAELLGVGIRGTTTWAAPHTRSLGH